MDRLERNSNMTRTCFPIAILLMLMPVSLTSADEVTLEPVKDAFVCDCMPGTTNPFAGNQYLAQGRITVCYHKSFIEWDLSSIPAGSTIDSAEFRIYCCQRSGGGSGQMVYYRLIEDWSETTVCYNNMPLYTEDGGIILPTWPAANSWHVVDVTDFVVDWFSGATDNYGLHCGSQNTSAPNDAIYYSSRVSASSYRPRLVVTYTIPSSLEYSTWGNLKVIE